MTDRTASRSLPPLPSLVQGGLVALGIVLWMTAGKAWIVVAGIGAFGPGMLRELGWLRDRDEFQREASHRAGFHAYLVGGAATVLALTGLHLGVSAPEHPDELVTLLLVVLWMTWMFSYLLAYWGPQRTAARVLLTFGSFWLLFAVLSGIGEAEGGFVETVLGIAMHLVVVVPFAAGAWTAGRWPRATGWFLLAASAALVALLGRPSPLSWTTQLLTLTILVVPLAASGLGLVRVRPEAGDAEG